MSPTQYLRSPMNDQEFKRMNSAFDELSIKHNNPIEKDERHGFVALEIIDLLAVLLIWNALYLDLDSRV